MAVVIENLLETGKRYMFVNAGDTTRALNAWFTAAYPAQNLSNVCLLEKNASDTGQQWVISKTGNYYTMACKENMSVALDLYTGSGTGANANAHLYTPSSTSYLSFEKLDNGNVTIQLAGNTNTNYYLTGKGGSDGTRTGKASGADGNVYFTSTKNGSSSEWIVVSLDGGTSGGGTTSAEYVWPTENREINRKYPYSPSNGHLGVDIKPLVTGVEGDEVYAYTAGRVSFIRDSIAGSTEPAEGYTVRIHHENPLNNGYARIRTQYMHLKAAPLVSVGESVVAGQLIGYMGDTGNSTGVHLHFEVRGGSTSEFPLGGTSGYNVGTPIDPEDYLALVD